MKKLRNIKLVRKQAWDLQSKYIRQIEMGQCFTCLDTRDWKLQQAGHYIHKDCLDFDLRNIHCQCVHCNKWLSGNSGIYAEKLIRHYGAEIVAELRTLSHQVRKFNRFELENLIEYYKNKLEEI